MSSLNSQLRFNDDGTPRRRYELDLVPQTKSMLGATIGLVLASTVLLVKNILFPAHPNQPMDGLLADGLRASETQAGAVLDDQSGIGRDAGIQIDDAFANGQAQDHFQTRTVTRLVSVNATQAAYGDDQAHRAPVNTSHIASNDNKALYGAAPGHGVSLAAHDAIPVPAGGGQGASTHAARTNAGSGDGELVPGDIAPAPKSHPTTVPAPIKLGNTAPVVSGPVSLANRFINQSIVIGLADLVANARDADGDTLGVTNVTPSSGTMTANIGGGWTFLADPQQAGDVTFSYAVSDGHAATPTTATLMLAATAAEPAMSVNSAAPTGSSLSLTQIRNDFATPIAEKIMQTPAAQASIINGTADNDVIVGTTGNDVIFAGNGDDIITAGAGNDVVYAQDGDDTLIATSNDGDDAYDGGDGTDTLDLSAIAPTPTPASAAVDATQPLPEPTPDRSADCVIDLEAGTATGGQIGHDTIVNIENVTSGAGNDTITGDAHANVLDGGGGTDAVDGGAGDDTIIATADAAADAYRGGEGTDTYDASNTQADAIIDLNEGTVDSADLGHDTIDGIEGVMAGSGDDIIVADEHVNVFSGGDGDDTFVFNSATSIGKGAGHHDVILDFAVGDKIDISNISKEFAQALAEVYQDGAMQDFVFIQNADKFSKPGELKLVYHEDVDATVLQGNIDFNDDAEFELEFKGDVTLTGQDFQHH